MRYGTGGRRGGALVGVTLAAIVTLCLLITSGQMQTRHKETATKREATVATNYWNSVTGEWNAASWGGALPSSPDTLYVDGRVKQSFLTSLDRSGDISVLSALLNGNFATDTVWTKGTGWTIAAGVASKAAGSQTNLSQAGILVIGRLFRVTFTLSGVTAGGIIPKLGSGHTGTTRTSNGTFTETGGCAGSTDLIFADDGAFVGNIDDVSVDYMGLQVQRLEFLEEYLGDVGTQDAPPKLSGVDIIWRGRGRFHFQPTSPSTGSAVDRLTIDTPNLSHVIQLGPNFDTSKSYVNELRVLRGPVRYSGIPYSANRMQRLFIGYKSNPILDARVWVDENVEVERIKQIGGQFIYKGKGSGADPQLFCIAGGYCQFDGRGYRYVQTSGHVDYGVEKLALSPLITEAWLLGGSMDATRATLGQVITTAYIAPTFNLKEDSKLTITNRVNLWE